MPHSTPASLQRYGTPKAGGERSSEDVRQIARPVPSAGVGRGGEASGAGSAARPDELAVASAAVFLFSAFSGMQGTDCFWFTRSGLAGFALAFRPTPV